MLNRLARWTILNPKVFLGGLAASIALNLALAGGVYLKDTEADAQRTRAVSAEATVRAQTTASQAIADAAKAREDTAKRALDIARDAGKADRAAAQRYLNLPLPAPADRCDAAQRLVDEAITENRQ